MGSVTESEEHRPSKRKRSRSESFRRPLTPPPARPVPSQSKRVQLTKRPKSPKLERPVPSQSKRAKLTKRPESPKPENTPFRAERDVRGLKGPQYTRPVHHQPVTTKRPGCIDEETGIEHRLSHSGRWLPVLCTADRTGKKRSKASKYKKKETPSTAPASSFRPEQQDWYREEYQRPPWKDQGTSSSSGYWRR